MALERTRDENKRWWQRHSPSCVWRSCWGPDICVCVCVCVCVLVTWSCPTLCDSMDYSPPGSSVHGILQARVLEWVAIPFSKGFSWPTVWTQVSCIAGRLYILYIYVYIYIYIYIYKDIWIKNRDWLFLINIWLIKISFSSLKINWGSIFFPLNCTVG